MQLLDPRLEAYLDGLNPHEELEMLAMQGGRPQQGGDYHIAAGLELSVTFNNNAAAKIIEDQRLVRFGQAELPW